MNITLHFDGSCFPNPGGVIGGGGIIEIESSKWKIELKYKVRLEADDKNTNNIAEYVALREGLTLIDYAYPRVESLRIFGDSALVINQMSGRWKIKEGVYADYAKICLKHIQRIKSKGTKIHLEWIPREQNKEADKLSR